MLTTSSSATPNLASASRGIASRSWMRLAAVTAACAALALPALAQSPAPLTPAPSTSATQTEQGHRMTDHAAKREQWKQKRAARYVERLAQLHQRLALSPTQETAWSSFEKAMLPAQRGSERLGRQGWKDLTTPERIDRMRTMRTQRVAAMDARGNATKTFYAQLQPAQQKTFDQASMSMTRKEHRSGHQHGGEGRSRGSRNEG